MLKLEAGKNFLIFEIRFWGTKSMSPGPEPTFVACLRLSYNGSALPLAKRKTVVSAGLLCIALTVVVLFTTPAAFRSPVAVIVMALIGTAAVLLQVRLRDNQPSHLRPPLWLNLIGILFAAAALFPSAFHMGPRLVQAMVLGAVGSFAISSAMILHSLRKRSPKPE